MGRKGIASIAIAALLCLLALAGCAGTPISLGQDPDDGATAQTETAGRAEGGNQAEAAEGASPAATGELTVRFIDVGQGDCALISCDGHHLLVDGGPSKASSKVYAILKALGITRLDAVVATHADADHVGGISGALSFATTDTCYCSVTSADTRTFASLVERLGSQGVAITVPRAGNSFTLGQATVTFVGPTRGFDSDNDSSLVCRVDFGSTSFLLEADAESASERAMLADGADVDADVIKVAHHGSKSSSSAAFLAAVSPAYAVISVGENTYGHPTDEALSRLAAVGAQVLRTDELGSITFTSDGASMSYTSGKIITE